MRNNHGFTLVEILVSIVILGLLVTVFFQFFVLSQKTTTGNQEKLVAINIAQGVLERIKRNKDFYEEITEPSPTVTYPKKYTKSICTDPEDKCNDKYIVKVNNIDYKLEIDVYEKLEAAIGLHTVEVRVLDEKNNQMSSVKGFVEIIPQVP